MSKSKLSEAAKADRRALQRTYEEAYTLFLDKMERIPTPKNWPLPYDVCKRITDTQWRTPFVGLQIGTDTSEVLNELNAWRENLLALTIWTDILEERVESKDNNYSIQRHFFDPLAYYCLFQPSATRERWGRVAETALHQANLGVIPGYLDELAQDKPIGKRGPNRYLSRSEREKQLKRLGQYWSGYPAFRQALGMLDSKAYRSATADFRNRASHGIPPRFRVGLTNLVVRSLVPSTKLVPQKDGSYILVEDPSKLVVSYAFGGLEPLHVRKLLQSNLQQYEAAVRVFQFYEQLLLELVDALKKGSSSTSPT